MRSRCGCTSSADDRARSASRANHPPMNTFLGVPVAAARRRLREPLPDGEGGRRGLHRRGRGAVHAPRSAGGGRDRERAAVRVSDALVGAARVAQRGRQRPHHRVRPRATARARRRAAARADPTRGSVTIALPQGDGARVEAAAGEGAERFVGTELAHAVEDEAACSSAGGASASTRCSTTRRSTRYRRGIFGTRTALYVPLMLRDEAIGVITAHDKIGADPRFTDEDVRLAEMFAQRAPRRSRAVAARRARRAAARGRPHRSAERRRLARELHDETGQALTSILLGLRTVEEAPTDDERAGGGRRGCASSCARRCRTFAGSPSSCGRRRSTTSASSPRSSG